MKTVTVSKNELLVVVQKNREEHIADYKEMMEEFKKDVEFKTQEMLEFNLAATKDFKKSISVREPTENTSDYDRVISMLKMSVDDIIQLDESEYEKYVMNNWHWSQAFIASKAVYGKGF